MHETAWADVWNRVVWHVYFAPGRGLRATRRPLRPGQMRPEEEWVGTYRHCSMRTALHRADRN